MIGLADFLARTDERRGYSRHERQAASVFRLVFIRLHAGTCRGRSGCRAIGLPGRFELSVENVEKPPLDFEEMQAAPSSSTATRSGSPARAMCKSSTVSRRRSSADRHALARRRSEFAREPRGTRSVARRNRIAGFRFLVSVGLDGDFKRSKISTLRPALRRICAVRRAGVPQRCQLDGLGRSR